MSSDNRESVSGAVLRDLFANSIDRSYRAGSRVSSDTWWKRLLMLVLVAALTATAVWAAKDLRQARVAPDSPAQQLRHQAALHLETQQSLVAEVDLLRSKIEALHGVVIPYDPEAVQQNNQLRIASSAAEVSGTGITISLDDSHAATTNEQLRDFDLQVIINGLWQSGAEAIAVNGQRLSGSSAIRSAGAGILVNLTPLASPYEISAIGDPVELQVEFSRSGSAAHLATLRDVFAVRVSLDASDQLVLPAASEMTLRYVEPVP